MTTLVAIQGKDWAAVGCESRSSGDDGRFMELAKHNLIENNGILVQTFCSLGGKHLSHVLLMT